MSDQAGFSTRRVVVLGAGFGGLTIASELSPHAVAGDADVAVVDRKACFSVGFSMQWAMVGRRTPEEGELAYASWNMPGVRFLQDSVAAILPDEHAVLTKSRRLEYDDLVLALGADYAPERIEGLEAGAYNLCDLQSVMQLKDTLASVESGTVAIVVSAVPFKCPPAPYEYAFLIDDVLSQRGVRGKVNVVVTSPEPQPMPLAGKELGDAMKAMLAERGIECRFGMKPSSVDTLGRRVLYEDGGSLRYEVLAAVYPHRAPLVASDAGLTDESGFAPVELGTFRASAPDVYAVGDAARLRLPGGKPHPKAGVFAEAQASTLAKRLAAEWTGVAAPPYEGRGGCFVEVGREMAAAAESHLLDESGPRFRLEPPSAEGLEAKAEFERVRAEKWFGR